MRVWQKGERGFSLVEVMAGTMVFLIGFVGISALQMSNIKGTAFSGDMTEALYLASNKLESLLGGDYSALSDQQGVGDPNHGTAGLSATGSDADGSDAAQGRNGMFTVYWNVAEDEPADGSKTVNVLVQWSVKGVVRTVSLKGMVVQ